MNKLELRELLRLINQLESYRYELFCNDKITYKVMKRVNRILFDAEIKLDKLLK